MAGEAAKKPWWLLTSSRAGSWWLAIFYTALAVLEPCIPARAGQWWWWLIGTFFVLTAAVAWRSLVWVLRHPQPAPGRASAEPPRAGGPDDG